MKRIPLYAQIALALIAGVVAGLVFGERAGFLVEYGKLLIQLIKAIAVPLLFLAVLDAFMKTKIEARTAAQMLTVSGINTVIAICVGLAVSNLFQPGKLLDMSSLSSTPESAAKMFSKTGAIDFQKAFLGYFPNNFVTPFMENSIVTIILIAVTLGWALRRTKDRQIAQGESDYLPLEKSVSTAFETTQALIGLVVKLVPFAVFCVVAKTIGEQGFAPFVGLAAYVGVALLGLAIQVFVIYPAWLLLTRPNPGGVGFKDFWKAARDPLAYALGASSSLATLPVTLASLARMKVSERSARLSACVGTNFNNDGIILYEAMAVLFVAQAHGIDLSLPQQLLAAGACIVAGIGIAGVPDAGLISLALVLATVGLPMEILPLLLTVDWLLSRARAMTNVVADLMGGVLLDRFEKR